MPKPVILCVDDEKLILDSLVNQLRGHFGNAYLYEMVENADEGWEVIKEMKENGHTIALVISDWLMPLEKGDKFLIDLSKRLPEAALIMLSGHAEEDAVERAFKYANLHSFVRKPWDKDHLMQEAEAAIAAKNAG